jgi:hypothetical protein
VADYESRINPTGFTGSSQVVTTNPQQACQVTDPRQLVRPGQESGTVSGGSMNTKSDPASFDGPKA